MTSWGDDQVHHLVLSREGYHPKSVTVSKEALQGRSWPEEGLIRLSPAGIKGWALHLWRVERSAAAVGLVGVVVLLMSAVRLVHHERRELRLRTIRAAAGGDPSSVDEFRTIVS